MISRRYMSRKVIQQAIGAHTADEELREAEKETTFIESLTA